MIDGESAVPLGKGLLRTTKEPNLSNYLTQFDCRSHRMDALGQRRIVPLY